MAALSPSISRRPLSIVARWGVASCGAGDFLRGEGEGGLFSLFFFFGCCGGLVPVPTTIYYPGGYLRALWSCEVVLSAVVSGYVMSVCVLTLRILLIELSFIDDSFLVGRWWLSRVWSTKPQHHIHSFARARRRSRSLQCWATHPHVNTNILNVATLSASSFVCDDAGHLFYQTIFHGRCVHANGREHRFPQRGS